MKYEILQDFPGSQDGRFTEQFKAGTEAELSDYLANIVVAAGWARLVQSVEPESPDVSADRPRRRTKTPSA